MRPVRALLFTALFYAWSAALAVAFVPLLAVPRSWLAGAGVFWARSVLLLLRGVVGVRSEVRGRERLPDGPALVIAKHQSTWDVIMLVALLPRAVFVLKRELTAIPLFGRYLRRNRHIAVDRAGGPAALRDMLAQARARIAEGRQIIIFPEGTRVPPGATRPYHPGAAALYAALQVATVPVALNSGLFWPRRQLAQRAGHAVMEVLPAMAAGRDRRDFARDLRQRLETASARLAGEAGGSAGRRGAEG